MLLVGCNSEPERLPVSGSVVLDGKAIGSCMLVFQSLGAEDSPVGTTALVSDGKFVIPKSLGLPAGEYGVVFTECQPDLDDYEAARKAGSKNALNKKFIPRHYTKANSLHVSVAEGMQPIVLEMKSRLR